MMEKRRIDTLSEATDGPDWLSRIDHGTAERRFSVRSRRNLFLPPCGSYPLKDMTLIARRGGPRDAPRESMTSATPDPSKSEERTAKRKEERNREKEKKRERDRFR